MTVFKEAEVSSSKVESSESLKENPVQSLKYFRHYNILWKPWLLQYQQI